MLNNCCYNNYRIFTFGVTLDKWTTQLQVTQGTSAHDAPGPLPSLLSSCSLGLDRRRQPGRPSACWTDQLQLMTLDPADLRRQVVLQGHGAATQRPELSMRRRRRTFITCKQNLIEMM